MNKKHLKAYRKTLWNRPEKVAFTINFAVSVLKELYDFISDEKLDIELRLIRNYHLKISNRLKTRQLELERISREESNKRTKDLIYRINPFLDFINK